MSTLGDLQRMLRDVTGGREVEVTTQVDPAIIGGIDRQARLPHGRRLAQNQTQCNPHIAMKEVG